MKNKEGIDDYLNKIRARLLDLTAKNRLLNYKYSKTGSIRVINDTPNSIFTSLINEGEMGFKALPKNFSSENIVYSLPYPSENSNENPQNNYIINSFSTDLKSDEMEKRLRLLSSRSKTAIEETGTNFLYFIIGFLEWCSHDDETQKYSAPLLLIPVNLKKDRLNKKTKHYEYSISYSGDDILDNISLKVKLKEDFDLHLPDISEDTKPEDYFEQVQQVIENNDMPWKIKRHASLSLLNFTNLLLYLDLDPEKWPDDYSLVDHPVINLFFKNNKEDGDRMENIFPENDYFIDDLPHAHMQYPLIENADSSQHSVLIDGINGMNMVVEGPPGTGKSQTITNIISAFIANGKKVLFVAEKMAALEVVKNRLDNAGLGMFCLEIHSNKTGKRKVVDELMQRINSRPKKIDNNTFSLNIERFEDLKSRLYEYAFLIYRKWKSTDLLIHEIITKAVYFKDKIPVEPEILYPEKLNGDNFTPEQQILTEEYLNNFYVNFLSCVNILPENTNKISHHPWFGLENNNLKIFDQKEVSDKLKLWQDKLIELNENRKKYTSVLNCLSGELPQTKKEFSSLINEIINLPKLHKDEFLSIIPVLNDENLTLFENYINDFVELKKEYNNLFLIWDEKIIANKSETQNINKTFNRLEQIVPLTESLKTIELLSDRCKNIELEISNLFEQFYNYSTIYNTPLFKSLLPTIEGLKSLKKIIEFVNKLSPSLIALRNDLFENDILDDLLTELKDLFADFYSIKNTLEQNFDIEKIPEKDKLKSIRINYLAEKKWSKWFSKSWRNARQMLKVFAKNKEILKTINNNTFENLEKYLTLKHEIENNTYGNKYLKNYYHGIETDLKQLSELRDWYKEIRIEYGIDPEKRAVIGTMILNMPEKAIKVFRHFKEKGVLQKINIILSDIEALLQIINPSFAFNETQMLTGNEGVLKKTENIMQPLIDFTIPVLKEKDILLVDLKKHINRLIDFQENVSLFENNETIKSWLGNDFQLNYIFDDETQKNYNAACHTIELADYIVRKIKFNILKNTLLKTTDKKYYINLNKEANATLKIIDLEEDAYAEFEIYAKINIVKWQINSGDNFGKLISRNNNAIENTNLFSGWIEYIYARYNLTKAGFENLINIFETDTLPIEQLFEAYYLSVYDNLSKEIFNEINELMEFSALSHENIRDAFEKQDDKLKEVQRERIAAFLYNQKIPVGVSGGSVKEYTDLMLIKHEGSKKRRQIPIRQLIKRAGDAVQSLKPCFMMSPLSVAKFIEPGSLQFDLVIMDEASQMKPEYALGSIARGKQLIIVGDSKQLPPSNFFEKINFSDNGDNAAIEESESILDATLPLFTVRRLRWHYRSQHESLIAFSNIAFYENDLMVFPAPKKRTDEFGIVYKPVGGIFVDRKNIEEATEIVNVLKEHFIQHPNETIGVVAMNIEQRELIENSIENKAKTDAEFRNLLEKNLKTDESLFVKNLENVQGDERDVVVISFTYGPDKYGGVLHQHFGPINNSGGWRRLNVLFTRARKRMIVISSFSYTDVSATNASTKGVIALKNFLRYAQTGNIYSNNEKTKSELPQISVFQKHISQKIKTLGYNCDLNVGVSGFYIDIAIKNPNKKDEYILGVLTDGENYHNSMSTRDRDNLRLNVLRKLGWNLISVWAPEWYKNPESVMSKIIEKLNDK